MPNRPVLSESSFLAHVFSPKKNSLPLGLRKRPIESAKGRKVSRVHAYNRMTAVKQEILKRTGRREAYLKGEINFVDARRELRQTAVQKNIVKPLRQRVRIKAITGDELKARIAANIFKQTRPTGKSNPRSIAKNVKVYLDDDDASEDMTQWSYQQIREAATNDYFDRIILGHRGNPFFYH